MKRRGFTADDYRLLHPGGSLGRRLVRVADIMTPRAQLITEKQRAVAKDPISAADKFFTSHVGINKMLVVDAAGRLRGLVTSSDVVSTSTKRPSTRA